MPKSLFAAAVAAALFGAAFAGFSEASEAGLPNSSFAALGPATSVPYGWVDFCGRRRALLMTVVKDLEGEGHAILTVKTDRGEFILDNLTDAIRPWDATGYTYVKRQAQDDPNIWLDLGGVRGLPQTAQTQAN